MQSTFEAGNRCLEKHAQPQLNKAGYGISRSPSSFLPAEKRGFGRTNRRTHPLTESWFTTRKGVLIKKIVSVPFHHLQRKRF